MQLKPSEIFYSQDSVSNTFDQKCRHAGTLIGETLDDICEGRCFIDEIPTISVVQIDGKWITRDNRRLWLFRHLERLGKCDEIPVNATFRIPEAKLTSGNGGKDIDVRRNPGGKWRYKPAKHRGASSRRSPDRRIYDSSTSIPYKPLSNISNQQNHGTPNRRVRQINDYASEPFSTILNQQRQITYNRQQPEQVQITQTGDSEWRNNPIIQEHTSESDPPVERMEQHLIDEKDECCCCIIL